MRSIAALRAASRRRANAGDAQFGDAATEATGHTRGRKSNPAPVASLAKKADAQPTAATKQAVHNPTSSAFAPRKLVVTDPEVADTALLDSTAGSAARRSRKARAKDAYKSIIECGVMRQGATDAQRVRSIHSDFFGSSIEVFTV